MLQIDIIILRFFLKRCQGREGLVSELLCLGSVGLVSQACFPIDGLLEKWKCSSWKEGGCDAQGKNRHVSKTFHSTSVVVPSAQGVTTSKSRLAAHCSCSIIPAAYDESIKHRHLTTITNASTVSHIGHSSLFHQINE
jgi:hypothetical protein